MDVSAVAAPISCDVNSVRRYGVNSAFNSELARRLQISQRVVAYYEGQTEHAPAHMLSDLAKVLAVSVDQLLGAQPVRAERVDLDVRLLRRIHEIQRLPPSTKRAVLKVIDDLLESHAATHAQADGR